MKKKEYMEPTVTVVQCSTVSTSSAVHTQAFSLRITSMMMTPTTTATAAAASGMQTKGSGQQ